MIGKQEGQTLYVGGGGGGRQMLQIKRDRLIFTLWLLQSPRKCKLECTEDNWKDHSAKHLEGFEDLLSSLGEHRGLSSQLISFLLSRTGEYISLYHHQRALLQQREIQKNDYIAQLASDREQLQVGSYIGILTTRMAATVVALKKKRSHLTGFAPFLFVWYRLFCNDNS